MRTAVESRHITTAQPAVTVTAGSHAFAAAAHGGRYMLLDADPAEILGAHMRKMSHIRG